MPAKHRPAIYRVLPKVVRIPWSGCWIFTGAVNEFGYGIVGIGGRGLGNDRTHRVTYQHYRGEIPEGMFVCHHCDVPSCCNPDHLFLGTNHDNVRDCVSKLRNSPPPRNLHVIGEAHPSHKMTVPDIVSIRSLREKGWTLAKISARFGICDATILRICQRKTWKHVA